jgi:hypothetical protein
MIEAADWFAFATGPLSIPAKAGTATANRKAANHHAATRNNIVTSLNGEMRSLRVLSRLYVSGADITCARLQPG